MKRQRRGNTGRANNGDAFEILAIWQNQIPDKRLRFGPPPKVTPSKRRRTAPPDDGHTEDALADGIRTPVGFGRRYNPKLAVLDTSENSREIDSRRALGTGIVCIDRRARALRIFSSSSADA